jgi:hypothetical protein
MSHPYQPQRTYSPSFPPTEALGSPASLHAADVHSPDGSIFSNEGGIPPPHHGSCNSSVSSKEEKKAKPRRPSAGGSSGAGGHKLSSSDIRRKYHNIFARAFNTCERDILESVLTKYCVPECMAFYKYVGLPEKNEGISFFFLFPSFISYFLCDLCFFVSFLTFRLISLRSTLGFSFLLIGGTNVQINGVEAILKFWLLLFTAIPDSVFEIHENKIRILSNGSSVSISKFLYYGTKILKLPTDDDHQSVIYSRSGPGTGVIMDTKPKKEEKPSFSSFHAGEEEENSSGKKIDDSNVIITQVLKTSVPEVASSTRLEENLGKALTDITLSNTYSVTHSTPLIDIKNPNHQVNEFEIRESLTAPMKLIKIGTFSIFINAEKKIYKFEFIHSVKDD